MARLSIFHPSALLILLLSISAAAAGETRLENDLPAATKGVIVLPDIDVAIERWNQTDLGRLMSQPNMKPFMEELQDAFQGDFLKLNERLGVQIGQLQGLRGGEVALALVQPKPGEHSAVMLINIKGRQQLANDLIAEITTRVESNGGQRAQASIDGGRIIAMRLPGKPETARHAYYVVVEDRLLITDRLSVANEVVRLIRSNQVGLGSKAAYQAVQKTATLDDADVRWYVEPFGLVEVLRAANPHIKRDSTDLFKVLSNQGFRAIEAVGGQIRLATEKHEILHRTYVYAPGGKDGSRFALAARMLSFPNSEAMAPQRWVPADLTSHITLRWDIRDAFEYSKTLVDEYAGEQVFDEIMKNIEIDENGPQINIRRELVANFGDRITIVADNAKPIDADSERVAVAIELTDAKSVRESLDRAMQHDPKALVHQVNEFHIWEMGGAEEEEEQIVVMIDDPFGGNPFGPSPGGDNDPEPVEEEEDDKHKLLSNLCFTVAHGQLLVSKKLELLRKILKRDPTDKNLTETQDFAVVERALRDLGAKRDSARFFLRTAIAYEPTYEMLRAGRLPESNSLVGRLLNSLAQETDTERLREQRIDGGTMPAFDEIRSAFGPAGMYMRSTDEGWVLTGCLLKN